VSDHRPGPALLARKSLARLRARGVGEVAPLVTSRVLEALWSEQDLIVFCRAAGGSAEERPRLELRRATASDGHRYERDVGTDSAATFAARLDDATVCYLALKGDRILHSSWVTRTHAWTRELGTYLQPPPGDAYVFESFSPPAARGMGMYTFALRGICADLAAQGGVDRVWVAVENDNLPSLRAVTKAGFEAVATISYRRRLGRLTVDPPTSLRDWSGPLPAIGALFDSPGGAGDQSRQ
jgi:hypothetical protein